MKRVSYVLAAIPAAVTTAVFFCYVAFYPVMAFVAYRHHDHSLAFRSLLVAAVCGLLGAGTLYAALGLQKGARLAQAGCMLTAVALFVLGVYLAYDLIYLPQRGPMASSEAGFALMFLALPMIFFRCVRANGTWPYLGKAKWFTGRLKIFAQSHR